MRHSGFSLTELLVALAIVTLLAGLLLPSIKFVRERANRIQCGSNQRQLAFYFMGYAEDQGGSLVTSDTTGGSAATSWLWTDSSGSAKLDANGNLQGLLVPYFESGKGQNWLTCPSMPASLRLTKKIAYEFSDRMNPAGTWSTQSSGTKCFRHMADIPKSSAQLLANESDYVWDGFNSVGTGAWGDRPTRYHLSGTNVLYVDGHSAWYQWVDPVGTLAAYRWYVPGNLGDVKFYHWANVPP